VGFANGAAISFLQLPPIIVTLAMLSIVRGSALMLGGPEQHLIRDKPEYTFVGSGNLFGLPFSIYVFALVALVMIFVKRRTPLGLLVAAIGDNERAAYLSGHRTRATKTLLLRDFRFGRGAGGDHPVLASAHGPCNLRSVRHGARCHRAVVLGGTSIMGGNGSVARTLLGVFFLGVVNDGMNILNVPIDIQLTAKGAIIVVALALAARAD
jgi:ribose/xylose/arabinose/galactoside ABC-type transport system permease subunit